MKRLFYPIQEIKCSIVTFRRFFENQPCFTARHVALRFQGFHSRQLRYWQSKGLIQLLRRPYYRHSARPWTLLERWDVANRIYSLSYTSLQAAMSYYGVIPEGVFHVTSVTTKNTATFEVDHVLHTYQNIKPSWFFGYHVLEQSTPAVRMATPDKTLLDLLYLNPNLNTPSDFEALRLDRSGIRRVPQPELWKDFLSLSTQKTLHARDDSFQKWLYDNA